MKTAGIPLWLTIVMILIILLSFMSGGMAMVGNGMDDFMGPSWGGRNLGLAFAAIVAILLKSPIAYIATLVGWIGRDVGDIVDNFASGAPQMPIVIFAVVLIAIWVYGIIAANKARSN